MALTEYEGARAYEFVMKMANRMINSNIQAFRQAVATKEEYETIMMKNKVRTGNESAAKIHRIRADIYHSLLQRI